MFTERFVEIIQEKKIRPYHIAKETGISTGLLSAYKRGEKIPSVENLIKIADYLDCSVDFLLDRTNDSNSHKRSLERN